MDNLTYVWRSNDTVIIIIIINKPYDAALLCQSLLGTSDVVCADW